MMGLRLTAERHEAEPAASEASEEGRSEEWASEELDSLFCPHVERGIDFGHGVSGGTQAFDQHSDPRMAVCVIRAEGDPVH